MTKERVLVGRPPLIRQTNAQILLRLLREAGPCSKADLVRASGLSAPSVTNVVAHLASAGLVEPIGEGDSTGGRPPDILRFKAERGCVAGVEISSDSLHFLLADLDGRELERASIALDRESSTPAAVCTRIGKQVRELLRKHKQPEEHLLGLVVGVPAIVNVDDGVVLAISALKDWSNVSLGTMLATEFKCSKVVENDTNLAARGEFYRGAAQGEKNFVFITIGEGVGAGIFVGGNLHRGSQWSAGEIGYLRVPNISRENPTVHKYGKLEKLLGAPWNPEKLAIEQGVRHTPEGKPRDRSLRSCSSRECPSEAPSEAASCDFGGHYRRPCSHSQSEPHFAWRRGGKPSASFGRSAEIVIG